MVSTALGKKIRLLNTDGLSQHKIAKKLGIAQSTVSDYLKSIGVSSDQSKTKVAVKTKHDYDQARRLKLNNKFFGRLEGLVDDSGLSPRDFKELMIAYGILEDKRAQIDPPRIGSENEMLDRIVGSLDQHALTVSPEASPSVPGLPQDPANPDVRVGEERQD